MQRPRTQRQRPRLLAVEQLPGLGRRELDSPRTPHAPGFTPALLWAPCKRPG